jgi:hypothetical protein
MFDLGNAQKTFISSGRPCVFHLLARIELSAMAALLDDNDGEGDAGAGGAGDTFMGRAKVRNLHKLSPAFARLVSFGSVQMPPGRRPGPI